MCASTAVAISLLASAEGPTHLSVVGNLNRQEVGPVTSVLRPLEYLFLGQCLGLLPHVGRVSAISDPICSGVLTSLLTAR